MEKIGRNDPCWCGSGMKYKKCHLNRQESKPVSIYEVDKILRKEHTKKYCCVPVSLKCFCSGDIIKAHTITRATSLKKIAKDDHVYGFKVSIEKLCKNNGILYPEKIGIRQASTFTGFCKKHDDELFVDIEKKPFTFTKRECFLHAYRALIREYFTKRAVVNTAGFRSQFDSGRKLEEQIAFQKINKGFSVGSEAGLKDIKSQKEDFETILATKSYENVNAIVLRFQKYPSVLASGGKSPVYCFDGGKRLQDLADLSITPCAIYYNAFCSEDNGYFVFTWLKHSDNVCRPFVESLKRIERKELSNAIIRFLFSSCENIYMAPIWWEALNDYKRNTLISRLATAVDLTKGYISSYLMDDEIQYNDWVFDSLIEL